MAPRVEIAGVFSDVEECDPRSLDVDEYVVLVNTGDEPVGMAGWSLTNLKADQMHHFRYLLPRFLSNGDSWSLEPGGMVIIYTGRGTNGATASTGEAPQYHFYQHRSTPVWVDPGDRVCLSDRAGQLVSACDLPVSPRKRI
jgi:hypothetical protein